MNWQERLMDAQDKIIRKLKRMAIQERDEAIYAENSFCDEITQAKATGEISAYDKVISWFDSVLERRAKK